VTSAERRAFSVHIFTASGAAFAFGALLAATSGRWASMFGLLGIALIVDGVDGALARRLRVNQVLPRWSGEALDLVVDFTSYVFVPAYAIAAGGLLPQAFAVPAGAGIVLAGAIYFADREMKTADNYFRGFPALWNGVAFYLFVFRLPPWLAAAAVALLVILTFAPFKFVHPIRVVRLRRLNMAALLAWSVLALMAVASDLAPPLWVKAGLVACGLYFLTIGFTNPARVESVPRPPA
jgi:phosphatidylcholine synthase